MKEISLFFLMILLMVIAGCSKKQQPISYGQDECEFCKMIVMDERYGAELVTGTGKIYFFDSIECLVGYLDNQKIRKGDYTSIWVGNFANPKNIIDAENAIYLKNDELRSPMGLNVLAVETDKQFEELLNKHGGKKLKYDELFELVRAM